MLKKLNKQAFTNLVPTVLVIVIVFAILFIGAYVNGTIHESLETASSNTDAEHSMNNISTNYDSSLDIVQIVIIISLLAMAIGAIFMFTRFG